MVICGQCGERNRDDARFCRVCEAFLEWEGEPVARSEPPGESMPVPVARTDQGPAARDQGPVAAPLTEPAPVQPAERVRPHTYGPVEAEERPLSPGDLICGQCGVGNPPVRRFCRRCAAPLADAAVVRPPWWRRFVPRWRRRVRRSGERPRTHRSRASVIAGGVFRGLRWGLGALLALALLAFVLVPAFRGWAKSTMSSGWYQVKSVVAPEYVPVRPRAVVSNGAQPEHPDGLVADLNTTSYWAVRTGGPQPVLTFTFETAVDLRRIIVYNGTGPGPEFPTVFRAKELHLVFSNGRTTNLTLRDTPDQQTLSLPGSEGSTEVRVHVVSAYETGQVPDVAIAEIEFYTQR